MPLRHRQRLIARTRGLFELLVDASGSNRATVARRLGRDRRTFEDMRDVPSLGIIVDLARGLGWEAPEALAVVAAGLSDARSDSGDRRRWLDAVCRADLLDDAHGLERLASGGSGPMHRPIDLALQCAVRARALVARGEVREAWHMAACARSIGWHSPVEPDDCAAQKPLARLLESVHGECMLGAPWAGCGLETGSGPEACIATAPDARDEIPDDAGDDVREEAEAAVGQALDPAGCRARCHGLAAKALAAKSDRRCIQVIAAIEAVVDGLTVSASHCTRGLGTASGTHGPCERRRTVAGTPIGGQEIACAWAASIASLTACRLADRAGLCARLDARCLHLAARGALVLEELAASAPQTSGAEHARGTGGDTSRPREGLGALARVRLARVALCELATRSRATCDVSVRLDAEDLAEAQVALVRFPSALRRFHRVLRRACESDGPNRFRHFEKSTLDRFPSCSRMDPVSSAGTGVAPAQPR